MSDLHVALDRRLAELRESFDRSFALPPPQRAEGREGFLIVHAADERYAISLEAVLGVEQHRKIVALPLQVPGLLGLAGLRGQLTPVLSLASLLGGSATTDNPAWLVLCKGDTPIALAFDHLDACVQVPGQDIHAAEPTEGSLHLTRQAVRLDSGVVYVVDIPSVAAAACKRLGRD